MNANTDKTKRICCYICAVLMLLLLVLQFMPFWHYGEQGELSASINAYIWLPSEYKDLTKHLTAAIGEDYSINQVLIMPIVTLILEVCGIGFCLARRDHTITRVFPAACGLVGIWGYLAEPAFRLGANWGVHLIVCIAMLLVSAYSLYLQHKEYTA